MRLAAIAIFRSYGGLSCVNDDQLSVGTVKQVTECNFKIYSPRGKMSFADESENHLEWERLPNAFG